MIPAMISTTAENASRPERFIGVTCPGAGAPDVIVSAKEKVSLAVIS
jgi:hypothetical protein